MWPKGKGATNFLVSLDGLPTDHVSRIESFTWSQDLHSNTVTLPELELTISMIDFQDYSDLWGLASQIERSGNLELLAGDLMTVLATIELGGVTFVGLVPSMEANQEATAVFKVRFHVNSMVFK